MARTFVFLVAGMFLFLSAAQAQLVRNNEGGLFSLGVRSTVSTFNHNNWDNNGYGYGGQFRLQFSERVNTEWYADFITSNIDGLANRHDYHVGWSVMFYPLQPQAFQRFLSPYILAGHCFDYTRLAKNAPDPEPMTRFSSAVQMGLGNSFNLTDRFDLTLTAQYMAHLGKDIHAHVHEEDVHFERHDGSSLEGHLLFTLSANYKIADLW